MKKTLIIVSAWSLPALAFAATAGVNGIFDLAQNILTRAVPLLISAAVVVFLYGVLTYVLAGGDEEKRVAGRHTMVSVWGLVNLLRDSLTLNSGVPSLPVLPR